MKKYLTIKNILSILVIFIIFYLSFVCTISVLYAKIMGLLFLLGICIVITITFLIIYKLRKKKYILNYILLIYIIGIIFGYTYMNIIYNYHKNNLKEISKEIDNFYVNSNNEYNKDEIRKIIENSNITTVQLRLIKDDYYIIKSYLKNRVGDVSSFWYNSDTKIIYNDGVSDPNWSVIN